MKRIKHPRNFLFPISLFFWTTIFSFKASADTSCNALLSDLVNHLKSNGQVNLQHLTNYQTNGQWWGGYTTASLQLSNIGRVGDYYLVGSGSRLISSRFINLGGGGAFGQPQPFSVRQPDPMSYTISIRKGTITFQGKYGPYDMTCLGDKFAIVNTGDSIETFTFSKSFGSH